MTSFATAAAKSHCLNHLYTVKRYQVHAVKNAWSRLGATSLESS